MEAVDEPVDGKKGVMWQRKLPDGSLEPVVVCKEPGARQSEAADCDLNVILARFERLGTFPDPGPRVFADVSAMGDYRSAVEQVKLADDLFMQLPAKVRARFMNSPAEFLDFMADPENVDEMVRLGLVTRKAPVAPVEPAKPAPEPAVKPQAL